MTKNRIRPTTEVACKPVTCPTCGTTDCIERPRYFSGQMLTDRDLDAAQRYVIDKNRLHNRYLVGTGTVCGLAVRCDRCDAGTVVVQPGYAIDCCGNDIVLCAPASFSVADWLHACRKKEDECGKIKVGNSPCDGLPKEYYLLLYYAEEPARPVTALMRADGCSNVRCEPSRMKETFRLTLVEKEEYKRRQEPNMWAKLRDCVGGVMAELKKLGPELKQIESIQDPVARNQALLQLFCRWRDYVLKLYKLGPNNRCTLVDELRDLEDLARTGSNALGGSSVLKALVKLFGYVIQYIIDCICDALLVPCSPCGDEGVILACLTVRDEKVIKICNTARTQIATGPAMRYWFQPLYAGIGKLIEKFCCELDVIGMMDDNKQTVTVNANAGVAKAAFTRETTFETTNASSNFAPEEIDPKIFSTFGTRGANLLSMSDQYTGQFGDNLGQAFLPFMNADLLNAADLYDMPVHDASAVLAERKVPYSVRNAATDSEAYSLGNIANMQWIIRSDRPVEMIVNANGRVTAVRAQKEAGR